MISLLQEAGPFAWVQLVVAAGGALWALVAAGMLAAKWKVPPVVALAPLFVQPMSAWAGTMYASYQMSGMNGFDPSQRAMVIAMSISQIIGMGTLTLVVIPVAAILGLGGLGGGVRAPRRWGPAFLAFFSCILVALLPLWSLAYEASFPLVLGRLLLYGLCSVPVAASMLSAHPNSNGREASVVAGGAWFSTVAACEIAAVSSAWSQGFSALAVVDPGAKEEILKTLSAEIGGQAMVGWVLVLAAAVPMVLALARSSTELTEEELLTANVNPSPMRAIGQGLALGLVIAWGLAFWSTDPSEILMALPK